MSTINFNKNLLGLQDVIIKIIEEKTGSINIHIQLEVKEHQCPCCNSKTKYIHDYRKQKVKDIPIRGKKCSLILEKRRYICKHCGKRFFEKNEFLPRYHQSTNRLSMWIINQLNIYSFKDIAKQTGLSSYGNFPFCDSPFTLSLLPKSNYFISGTSLVYHLFILELLSIFIAK